MKKFLILLIFIPILACGSQSVVIPTVASVAQVPDFLTATPKPTLTPRPTATVQSPYKTAILYADDISMEAIQFMRQQKSIGYSNRDFDQIGRVVDNAILALDAVKYLDGTGRPYHSEMLEWARYTKLSVETFQKCMYDRDSTFECDVAEKFLDDAWLHWDNASRLSQQ